MDEHVPSAGTETQLPNTFTIHDQTSQPSKFILRGDDRTEFLIEVTSGDTDEPQLSLFSSRGEDAHLLGIVRHYASNRHAEITLAATQQTFKMSYNLLANRQAVHEFSADVVGIVGKPNLAWRNSGSGWRLFTGEDEVAAGSLNIGSKKPPSFGFVVHSDDALWKLVVVLSWLRIWDKVRMDMVGVSEGDEVAKATGWCLVGFCVVS